jgi:hypothetical protein
MRGSGTLSRRRASWITLIRRWLSPRGIGVFPSALIRIFVYDSISRLDDFTREYRGYVGKMMDYVCEELRSPFYEALEEGDESGGE